MTQGFSSTHDQVFEQSEGKVLLREQPLGLVVQLVRPGQHAMFAHTQFSPNVGFFGNDPRAWFGGPLAYNTSLIQRISPDPPELVAPLTAILQDARWKASWRVCFVVYRGLRKRLKISNTILQAYNSPAVSAWLKAVDAIAFMNGLSADVLADETAEEPIINIIVGAWDPAFGEVDTNPGWVAFVNGPIPFLGLGGFTYTATDGGDTLKTAPGPSYYFGLGALYNEWAAETLDFLPEIPKSGALQPVFLGQSTPLGATPDAISDILGATMLKRRMRFWADEDDMAMTHALAVATRGKIGIRLGDPDTFFKAAKHPTGNFLAASNQ